MFARLLLTTSVLACGCSKSTPKATTPTPPPVEPITRDEPRPSTPPASTTAVSANLAAGADLLKSCTMHFKAADEVPKFDFNAVDLLPSDREVLDQIATCLTKGPLQGKSIAVIGHADPRGTDEYNLGLGDRRAHSVGDYLSTHAETMRPRGETIVASISA